jgi:hypothetical protein
MGCHLCPDLRTGGWRIRNNEEELFWAIWGNVRQGLKQLRAARNFALENYKELSPEARASERGRRAKDAINEVERVIAHLKKVIKEIE